MLKRMLNLVYDIKEVVHATKTNIHKQLIQQQELQSHLFTL